ncbi:MAG: 2-hydroxyglutaryl-CoA dehydratase [Deltaproteobacteria bacterium]|nr:2-hydroxyglutaryl-CoA dehydratase [Deltaproteobacteria bacterium]
MLFAGVDLGSTTAKVVIMEKDVLASILGPTGAEHRRTANKVMTEALDQVGAAIDDIEYVVATGYGRINVPFADKQITEISCHARGVHWSFPSATAVIDIGGQDSKGMRLNKGKVADFVMNDKCAAGTGRFLEVISEALGLKVEDIGPISLKSQNIIKISNVCTVFAEQEVVAKLAEGAKLEDILAGLHDAIASRINAMFSRLKMQAAICRSHRRRSPGQRPDRPGGGKRENLKKRPSPVGRGNFFHLDGNLCKTSNFVEIAEGENLTRRNIINISRT